MYATGMKTGMTDEAGYCVVATAERFEHQLICIVFDAESSDLRWNDAIALLDAAFVQVRNEVNS
jgi:D-alanyl-D-alanine carboxypeptidase (penicillin-binding protein 5/6)